MWREPAPLLLRWACPRWGSSGASGLLRPRLTEVRGPMRSVGSQAPPAGSLARGPLGWGSGCRKPWSREGQAGTGLGRWAPLPPLPGRSSSPRRAGILLPPVPPPAFPPNLGLSQDRAWSQGRQRKSDESGASSGKRLLQAAEQSPLSLGRPPLRQLPPVPAPTQAAASPRQPLLGSPSYKAELMVGLSPFWLQLHLALSIH